MASNSTNTPQEQPGLVAGHAEYAKGAAQSAVGAATGSHPWTSSGEQAKAHAVAGMQAAGAKRGEGAAAPGGGEALGKAEEMVGRAVGCEGMRVDGAKRAAAGAAALEGAEVRSE